MLLPDVNIWLAIAIDSHVHHKVAKSWFDHLPDDHGCLFCRMTQQGFLRLATNPHILREHAVRLPMAWQLFDQFSSDSQVGFRHEPASVEGHWRAFTQSDTFSPNDWNNAYLAAFALCDGLKVITFDKGFRKFSGLSCDILS